MGKKSVSGVYLVGAAMLAAALFMGGLIYLSHSLDALSGNLLRFTLPATRLETLTGGRAYFILQEMTGQTTVADAVPAEKLIVNIRGPGDRIPMVRRVEPVAHYMLGGRKVVTLAEFTAPVRGQYTIKLSAKEAMRQCVILFTPYYPGRYILEVAIAVITTVLGLMLGMVVLLSFQARHRRKWEGGGSNG